MSDPNRTSSADARDPTGVGLDQESAKMPRWVKVFAIIAAVVVLLFVILLLADGGQHGPGRHL